MEIRSYTIFLIHLISIANSMAGPVKSFPLDETTVYRIGVATDQVTTIMFPSPISALEGSGTTLDPKVEAPVLMNHTPGKYFFSVRSLKEPAKAQLNVIWNRKIYVLQFDSSLELMNSVTFIRATGVVSRDTTVKVGPSRLLELLDKAKAYPVLAEQHPDLVHHLDRATPNKQMLYRDFRVKILEVFRFEAEDTLIFHIELINESDKEIYYQPQALSIRVGTNVYPCSVADASGIIPPGVMVNGKLNPTTTRAYFAVTGTPDGGRNLLSVENDFNVIVTRQNGTVTITQP